MNLVQSFVWSLKMAWRDSRTYRRKLLFFTLAIVLGTSALVAINSLKENLTRSVLTESKSLLGADLLIESSEPFQPQALQILDSLKQAEEKYAQEVSFSSMVLSPISGKTRLAQVRALEGDFPFYGEMETEPSKAKSKLSEGRFALVDEGLLVYFNTKIGDSLKVGKLSFLIAGKLKEIPGEAALQTFVGPRVYIPKSQLANTGLIQRGSRTKHKVFLKLNNPEETQTIVSSLEPQFDLSLTRFITPEDRQQSLGKAIENLYRFLNLTGFIALLLGSIGIASAVNVYVKQKLDTIATIRCLGTKSWQTLVIYLTQAMAMGVIGTLAGALLGIGVQFLLPALLSDLLPINVDIYLSPLSILQAAAISLGITLNFALLPLISVRRISPLRALRTNFEENAHMENDPLRWLIYGLIVLGICTFSVFQINSPGLDWWYGLIFPGAVGVALGLLALITLGFILGLKRYFPNSASYVWRQGLSNLFRPNNQTVVLILTIGLGTFFITTLYFTQDSILKQVNVADKNGQPNLILYDIQPDQKQGVENLLAENGLGVMQSVPIVTMRFAKVKDVDVRALRKDSTNNNAYFWEYRTTYRDTLTATEKVLRGKLHQGMKGDEDMVEVSLATLLADQLNLKLGDTLTFDVQGLLLAAKVTSIRQLNFSRIQPNFSILFPSGVLEEAPQFYAMVTRTKDSKESALIQKSLVEAFPNVSSIDLELILQTLDGVLSKITLVIRFMAGFSIITGFIVLAGAILTSRYQRIRESVLLRSLGAVRSQVMQIMVIEYFFLGIISAVIGVGLSLLSSWALTEFIFNSPFVINVLPVFVSILLVVSLTIGIGLLISRGAHNRSPLEILRLEAT